MQRIEYVVLLRAVAAGTSGSRAAVRSPAPGFVRRLQRTGRPACPKDLTTPVLNEAEAELFGQLMSRNIYRCHVDWEGWALEWDRICLAKVQRDTDHNFGDIYPKRPCHLKEYMRLLERRVDEQLLCLAEWQAVGGAAAATASGAARVHSGTPAAGVGRSEGGVLGVPSLGAGVVAGGAAAVSAAAGGAAAVSAAAGGAAWHTAANARSIRGLPQGKGGGADGEHPCWQAGSDMRPVRVS